MTYNKSDFEPPQGAKFIIVLHVWYKEEVVWMGDSNLRGACFMLKRLSNTLAGKLELLSFMRRNEGERWYRPIWSCIDGKEAKVDTEDEQCFYWDDLERYRLNLEQD